MTTTAGASDIDRTIDLLWRQDRQEPTSGLHPGSIVAAAVAVADAVGLAGLSMRKVAERLGYTSMSLYRHVPGRDHLIALMRDAAYGPPPDPTGGDWRGRLEALARHGWERRKRHRWLAEIRGTRNIPGPNIVAHYERTLDCLTSTGLRPSEVVAAADLIGRFLDAEALSLVETAASERASGESDDDWWGAQDSLFAEFDRYPTIEALWTAGGFDPKEDSFEFGLARLLDGIEQLVRARDENRDEIYACQVCGGPLANHRTGRPRTYCSRACQQRSYRSRRTDRS